MVVNEKGKIKDGKRKKRERKEKIAESGISKFRPNIFVIISIAIVWQPAKRPVWSWWYP